MKIFPAIDIKDKKCVRLVKGDFNNKTEYQMSPADQASKFKDIKGFKKQFISMSEKKINRIKEVKKSNGFPVYEGETSLQVTVN